MSLFDLSRPPLDEHPGRFRLHLPEVVDPIPEVEELIARLAVAVIGETTNHYSDECPGGAERRERLRQYLTARWRTADIVLVGEAAGYRGCRLSGIAFTSVSQLGIGSTSEGSATVVHRTLQASDAEERVILWNAVPTHPHRPDEPLTSNRTPTRVEVKAGIEFLEPVTAGRRVVAVGKVAARVLGDDVTAVRHPAYGGAAEFDRGMRDVLSDGFETVVVPLPSRSGVPMKKDVVESEEQQ